MAELLRVPYLGTAEEDVLLSGWSVAEGAVVHRGMTVATVETLKASFAVEADGDGALLRRLVAAGERVAVRAPLAVVGDVGERIDDAMLRALLAEPTADEDAPREAATLEQPRPFAAPAPSATAGTAPAAPAARRLAAELQVDLGAVRGTGPAGLIRLEDVEATAGSAPTATDASGAGLLDEAFLAFLHADGAAFGRLDSEFKVSLYRRHGAVIGPGCRIGPGTVLRAGRIVLGKDAHFGPDCSVQAGELVAGDLLHFGARCRVRCTHLHFGDNAFFTDDIEIGGGGAMDPEAELIVGSHGFVGEHVHLNPCRTLRIGDEVVISRNAVIMTHSFGGSALGGYPVRFAGVVIGSLAQVGIGAVLFPGVELGEGAILLSGSSLVTSVPAGRLYGGVPAVDLKAAAVPLDPAGFAAACRDLVVEFARQMELRHPGVEQQNVGDDLRVVVTKDGRRHVLRFASASFDELSQPAAEEVRMALRFGGDTWDALPAGVAGIDLSVPSFRGPSGPLADAFREFLRKRGVRLRPRSWAYRGGWL